jgi:hypothetical protein
MFKTLLIILLGMFTSCTTSCTTTYSIVMNHSEGEASDMMDETQTPNTQINPNVSIIPK